MELITGGDVLGQTQVVIGDDAEDCFLLPGQPRGRGVASSRPEVLEEESGNDPQMAQPAVLGQILNGRIHQRGDQDFWRLTLSDQLTVELNVAAVRPGSPLDSVLTVLDAEGIRCAAVQVPAGRSVKCGSDARLRFHGRAVQYAPDCPGHVRKRQPAQLHRG